MLSTLDRRIKPSAFILCGGVHHLEMKTACLWLGGKVNVLHLVIHFYLVEETEMVIVFIDRDLEQN